MKAIVQTRILLGLTVDEARSAVNNSTDLQLALRSALYEIDGRPILELRVPKRALLDTPSKNGRKPKAQRAKHKITAPGKLCPHCGETKNPRGYYRHVASCALKHPHPVVEEYPEIP